MTLNNGIKFNYIKCRDGTVPTITCTNGQEATPIPAQDYLDAVPEDVFDRFDPNFREGSVDVTLTERRNSADWLALTAPFSGSGSDGYSQTKTYRLSCKPGNIRYDPPDVANLGGLSIVSGTVTGAFKGTQRERMNIFSVDLKIKIFAGLQTTSLLRTWPYKGNVGSRSVVKSDYIKIQFLENDEVIGLLIGDEYIKVYSDPDNKDYLSECKLPPEVLPPGENF